MSLEIDKEWMTEVDRTSPRYLAGVALFLEFVVKYGGGFDKYLCPCNRCQNMSGMVDLPGITYHLLNNGIDQSYIFWKYHGEKDLVEKNLVEKNLVKDIDKLAAKSNGQNDDQNKIDDIGSRCSRLESLVDGMISGRLPTDQVASQAPLQGISTSTTHIEFEHKENVAILNIAKKVVAHGIVVKDGTSQIVHGHELEDGEVKVLLDTIFLPDDILYLGTQGNADNYADVGIGGFLVHHKSFLKRIN